MLSTVVRSGRLNAVYVKYISWCCRLHVWRVAALPWQVRDAYIAVCDKRRLDCRPETAVSGCCPRMWCVYCTDLQVRDGPENVVLDVQKASWHLCYALVCYALVAFSGLAFWSCQEVHMHLLALADGCCVHKRTSVHMPKLRANSAHGARPRPTGVSIGEPLKFRERVQVAMATVAAVAEKYCS